MSRARLTFEVAFHGPFRVGTGNARDGLDESVNSANPLPGSSLKGLMRAASRELLGADARLVAEVFGSETAESPWAWTDTEAEAASTSVQARIRIDEETGTVQRDFLFFAEQVEAVSGVFKVIQRRGLGDRDRQMHEALLILAAMAVKQVGSDRRRGLGWVSIGARPQPESVAALLAVVREYGHA